MVNSEPKISPSDKYELREVAEILEVSKSTVLRWTLTGLLACSIRKANGRRVWSGASIIRAWRSIY